MGESKEDIRAVSRHDLKSINSVKIDSSAGKQERIRSFIEQIGDPNCYLDGDMVVKISYADTDVTLEERLISYLGLLMQG